MKTEKNANYTDNIFNEQDDKIKWLSDNTIKIAEMYSKEIIQSIETYNKIFDSSFPFGKIDWMPIGPNAEIMKKNTELFLYNFKNFSEKMQEPFGSAFSTFMGFNKKSDSPSSTIEGMMSIYEKQILQMIDYNKKVFDKIENNFKLNYFDNDNLIQKLTKKMQEDFLNSSNLVNKYINSYKNKTDFSMVANKILIDELTEVIENLVKNNKDFWTNTMAHFGEKKNEEKIKMHAK